MEVLLGIEISLKRPFFHIFLIFCYTYLLILCICGHELATVFV